MAPRSLASSSLKSDTGFKSTLVDGGVMNPRKREYDRPGSSYTQNVRSQTGEDEDLSASKPRLEGFCRGSWWEVDIVQQRDKYFLAKYLSPSAGEEDAWLPLDHLRLKNRKSDDWDCNILKRGIDISVNCRHPDSKELKLHSRAIYDAKITNIARVAHKSKCTCRFSVRLYCADTEDPIGCTRERLLLTQASATRDVTISAVSILQQPGIVPFYEILKSHLSRSWIQVSRWSNDAFFLSETQLKLHLPPDYGGNRLYDDDEDDDLEDDLLATAVILEESPKSTYSSRVHLSSEQETIKVTAPRARCSTDPGQFPESEPKNCAEHFTAAGGDPSGGNVQDPETEPDICAATEGMHGGANRDDPESSGAQAAVADRDMPELDRSGVKRARDEVPVCSRKKQGFSPEKLNKGSVGGQKESELPSRNPGRGQDMTATSLGEGNSQDDIVDIGGSSSDEGDVYIQPQVKRAPAKNVQTSVRRSNEGVEKRQPPIMKRDDGPSERIPDGGFDKYTNEEDIPGFGIGNREEGKSDCEVVEMDPTIKGSVSGRTKGLKAGRKKVDTNVCAGKVRIDSSQVEEHEIVREPKKPLTRLRARTSAKKQVPGIGGTTPAGTRHTLLKPRLGKENGGLQKVSKISLDLERYLDLLDKDLEDDRDPEKGTEGTVKGGIQKRPKFGLNADWDPTSFRYPVPTLEEKRAQLKQQQQQKEDQQQKQEETQQQQKPDQPHQHQLQQPKQSVVDVSDDPELRTAEDEVLIPNQEGDVYMCRDHEKYLKEDVGTICEKCGLVLSDIESLVPALETRQRRYSGEASDWDFGRRSPDAFEETTVYQTLQAEKEATWIGTCNLPRRIQLAMHPHQKDGFAFLWRNLASGEGSDRKMRQDRNAGCILSHAPGTGKTFLVIAFLQSYMNQFPTCKPVVVAPKIMLRQWEKEFQRWKSDVTVYILNTAQDSGTRQIHKDTGVTKRRKISRLNMLYEWLKSRSVLLVSYTLFSGLTHQDYPLTVEGALVRKCLLERPSLLVLDEGHFPRNKGTRIRQALMTVRTNVRILLSGTLFQNNFEELFNTLYLVRPGFVEGFARFVPESSGDDRHSNLKKFLEMEQVTKEAENRARKLFVEEVGMKIEQGQSSKVQSDELDYGLERLGALTTDFVHHHKGEVLAALPGLRDFALILRPTQQQCSLLELLGRAFHKPSQYLEREIAVSQTSIHPRLVRNLEFAKFLDMNSIFKRDSELRSGSETADISPGPVRHLASSRAAEPIDGVKTKFAFDLVRFCKAEKEKVLIFSQHIHPLDLLMEMFIAQFKWTKNVECLKLDGTLKLDERMKIIDQFNSPNSGACVLLASTRACGEGISLIGASRVVFLDVLWNPAVIKQATSRAFRLGQKKIVYVYRLIASGTIEESKYKKAIRKDWLSRSIFSAPHGEPHGKISNRADEDVGEVKNEEAGGETGVSNTMYVQGREFPHVVNKKVGLNAPEQEVEEVDGLRKIKELLAWEVDVTTCKDLMLQRVLEEDKRVERRTFLKVIEHGSDFREKTIPFGPDAREWFLEGLDDNEPLDMKEVNLAEADPAITDSDDEVV